MKKIILYTLIITTTFGFSQINSKFLDTIPESKLATSVQNKLNSQSNSNIVIATSLTDITNAGVGASVEIRDGIILTGNFTPPADQFWYLTTGYIDCSTYVLTGSNTAFEVNGDALAIKAVNSGNIAGTWRTPKELWFTNVGGVADFKEVSDAAITGTTLTSADADFTTDDVGDIFNLQDAGATGTNANTLIGTITGYTNESTVTVSISATTNVTGKKLLFGTDNFYAGKNFEYLRNQTSGLQLYPEGQYFTSVVEFTNTDTGINNYGGWRIGDGITHITLQGFAAEIIVSACNFDRFHLFTLFDTNYYNIVGLKLRGNYDYQPNTTEFPSLINIGTAAYNGRIIDCNITKSIGDGLVTIADGQFQSFLNGANFTVGNIDDSGTIQVGETDWLYSDLINIDTGDFTASADKRGFRFFALTGASFGGWSGLTRPEYYVAYYDAGGTFIEKSPMLQFYQQVRADESWKQIRILVQDVVDKNDASFSMQIRPSLHARGLYLNNVNISFCGRQGASNLPYDTVWEYSDIFENGNISPGAGIDIEDERRSAENYTFRGLRMWNNFGGDIILINPRNNIIDGCFFLPNTKPDWNVQGNNTDWSGGVSGNFFGRNTIITNSVFYNRGFSVDRNCIVKNNIIREGNVDIKANSCLVEGNTIYNGGIRVDYQSSTNREKSIIRGNLISLDKRWAIDLCTDRNQSADWVDNTIRINDISRLTTTNLDHSTTGITFEYDSGDPTNALFTQLGGSGTSGFLGGVFKDFKIEGAFKFDTQHSGSFALLKLIATDYDGFNAEGGIAFNYGEEKDIVIKNAKIRGFAHFGLNEFTVGGRTVRLENCEIIIKDGDFDWTDVSAAVLKTPALNVNFEFYNCKIKVLTSYTITASAHRFIQFQHTGTTLMEGCLIETKDAEIFDLTSTAVASAGSGIVTLKNNTFINVTPTLRASDLMLYTYPHPNAPLYIDNATAVAALGVGYYYRDSDNSNKFEITY